MFFGGEKTQTMRISSVSFIYKSRYWNLQIMHIYLHSLYCGFPDKHTVSIDVQGPKQAHVFESQN